MYGSKTTMASRAAWKNMAAISAAARKARGRPARLSRGGADGRHVFPGGSTCHGGLRSVHVVAASGRSAAEGAAGGTDCGPPLLYVLFGVLLYESYRAVAERALQ